MASLMKLSFNNDEHPCGGKTQQLVLDGFQ